jgi:AmiR/NasT family two-component response regulator
LDHTATERVVTATTKLALRVAVADDESLIRRWLQDVLPDMGHQVVVVAENGRQLVEGCLTAKPDLVISDIKMPEMDGIDAALMISAQSPAPIILVSAFHDEDLIERASASHIMAYLIKPIGQADLAAAIAVAHRRYQGMKSLQKEAQDLRQSLDDRKTIEKAKGLVMKFAGLGEEEAFRQMQRMACDKNLKLIEIARKILEAGPTLQMIGRKK